METFKIPVSFLHTGGVSMFRKFFAAALVIGLGVLPAPAVANAVPTTIKADVTFAQENAIESAKDYLEMSAFSKSGLIKQLVYEDFSAADATFAVGYIESTGGVDWNVQAAKSAKDYLEMSSFSVSGLLQQLQYEGFTPSEAQYGVSVAYR